jgi:hypothetical protein
MTSGSLFRTSLCLSFFVLSASPRPAAADASHARVIRLSTVEGDVRFTRAAHGDPLADQKAVWEKAQPNLPIRQGYVVATDEGRTEVEFENGAMAFLGANTVLDFYDLTLEDGVRTTRLVLRQGSASFYINPLQGEYFSVTGGDFTVEASGKSSFRMNNFDDGSNLAVLSGRVSLLHKKDTTQLIKGQFLSMKAGDDSQNIGQLPASDDFDHWVAGRIESVSSATNASLQYTGSSYYAPGFADLYTYGSWFGCGGGFGWRPFGASLGWSPFTMGQWMWDPGFGWSWLSYQPWGWAPYHYGGWLFDASCGGWFYSPGYDLGFYPGYGGYGGYPRKRVPPIVHPPRPVYRASTAVFVRQNGKLGIVPMNPLDKPGKPPLNLGHGVFTTELTKGSVQAMAAGGEKWETVKSPPRDALSDSLVSTTAPTRTSRSMLEGNAGTHVVSLNRDSSIVYDPAEHRFVTTNAAQAGAWRGTEGVARNDVPGSTRNGRFVAENGNPGNSTRVPSAPTSARSIPSPPSPHTSSFGGGYRGGGAEFGGGAASRGSSAPSASASAAHASAPAASSGGGGRPH